MKTSKGNELPLIKLKGKDYLTVAYRLVWLNDDAPMFRIQTELTSITDDQTVCRAMIQILSDKGEVLKVATATKRETRKDFADHTEKAETGAIGRALAMLGFGTQFAIADLDEGERIVDAPIARVAVGKKKAAEPVDDF